MLATYVLLPTWVAWPCGVAFILGIYGLGRAIGWAQRLYDPPANAFKLPAAQEVFPFTLTAAGTYEVACTRPGQWGRPFTMPPAVLEVRRLPDGPVQRLEPGFWSWNARRANMDGDTTERIADFGADQPGDYELRNLTPTQFHRGDLLRVQPSTAGKMLPLTLLFLVSGLATIGGFVVGLIAGLGGKH